MQENVVAHWNTLPNRKSRTTMIKTDIGDASRGSKFFIHVFRFDFVLFVLD